MNRRAFFAGLALAPVGVAGMGKAAEAVTVTLKGEAFPRESVEDLIYQLNEAQRDGYTLVSRTVFPRVALVEFETDWFPKP